MTIIKDDRSPPERVSAGTRPARDAVSQDMMARGRLLALACQTWVLAHRDEALLLGPVAVYLGVVGLALFHAAGLVMALVAVAVLATLAARLSADTMLSLYRAEPIAPGQGAALRSAISLIAERAQLPQPPAIAVIPSDAIGAFSVGRHPRLAILFTEGLLRRFSLREIAGIAAHEVAHIKANDLGFFALADVTTRLAQALAYVGVALFALNTVAALAGEQLFNWGTVTLLLLAPCANSQLQLRLPRQREHDADRLAAQLLGDVATMTAVALAMPPDFGAIIDDFRLPVPQRRSPIPSPVRAHLAGSERADKLRTGEPPVLLTPFVIVDEPLISLVGVGPIEMRARDRWPGLWF